MRRMLAMAATAMMVTTAMAQTPPLTPPRRIMVVPPCPPPPEFAHWGQRHYVTAATRLGTDAPALALDDTIDLMLAPVGSIQLVVPLGKPAQPADRGGLVTFRAPMAGTYRIALGGHAWIDVVRGATPVASSAHQPGPACSGIVKMVDFPLRAGDHTIQLSADADPSARIAITRLP